MMRILALTGLLVLAGCMTPDASEPETNETDDGMPGGFAAPPAPIEDSQTVTGSADPGNFVSPEICSTPSAQCSRYPFTANGTVTIVADLTWTLPASDFDFYVLDSEGAQAISGASPPGPPSTAEHMEGELEAGDYEIVVVPWSVAQDTFTLSATFTAVGGNATSEQNATLAR